MSRPARGLFITGVDTDVGKTYVAAVIARRLAAAGCRVGVYKPAESGCRIVDGEAVAEDAATLWEAAGRPGTLDAVCPQRFTAPLAPHLAARAEGRELDAALLREGLSAWADQCDIVLVEGAGGLMSPLGDDEYVADLAADFGYPLIVVAANALGVINQALQTLITAATFREGLQVAGVVLNDRHMSTEDPSTASNLTELQDRCVAPVLAHIGHGQTESPTDIDWFDLAQRRHANSS